MSLNFVKIGLFLAVAAAVMVGCGGGDDETALTKAQIIKQGDAICKRADDDQLRIIGRLNREKSMFDRSQAEQAEIVAGPAMEPVQRQAEELGELSPPEADAEEFEAIVEAMEGSVKKAKENPEVMLGNNPLGVFAAADKAAEAYGFKVCSEAL